MNERILKLAEQAGMYVDLNGKPWPKWMSAEACEAAYEKFAELIVRECADIDFRREVGLTADDDYEIGKVIKVHFGVEP
jgi:hypothetical protein